MVKNFINRWTHLKYWYCERNTKVLETRQNSNIDPKQCKGRVGWTEKNPSVVLVLL